MGEVEPQPIRPHIRPFLSDFRSQNAPQRPVQKMGRTVMSFDSGAPFLVQSHLHRASRINDRLRKVHRHAPRPTDRRDHFYFFPIPLDPPRVPYLPSHLTVKWRLPQKHPALCPRWPHPFQCLGRYFLHFGLLRLLIPSENSREVWPRLILHLDCCLALGQPCPGPLFFHGPLKTCRIDCNSPFPC